VETSSRGSEPVRSLVGRFAQHTKLVATSGNTDRLVRKFLQSIDIQRDNPDCEFMMVSRSPVDNDVVYLTEVWSSEEAWEGARHSTAIAEWAREMPSLVAAPPETVRLEPIGMKNQVDCPG
jgi:quinol monooxygenase YgiN